MAQMPMDFASVAEVVQALERLGFRRAVSSAAEVTAELSRCRPPPLEENVRTALLLGVSQGFVAQVALDAFRVSTNRQEAQRQEGERQHSLCDERPRDLSNPRPREGARRLGNVRPRQGHGSPRQGHGGPRGPL